MIKKTAQEVADCLNKITDNTAKLNGQARLVAMPTSAPEQNKTPKWKKRVENGEKNFRPPSSKGQTWRQKNKTKKVSMF